MQRLPLSVFMLLTFAVGIHSSYARVFPAEGAQLNYRIIGFSIPPVQKCNTYRVEIDTGDIRGARQFVPAFTTQGRSNKVIAEVPQFGKAYTWRYVYVTGNKEIKSELYHFATLPLPSIANAQVRMKVTMSDNRHNDLYTIADGTSTMFDMKGNPVWFFPSFDNVGIPSSVANDIKCSPQHTITAICGTNILEIDYDGRLLWNGPDPGVLSGSVPPGSGPVSVPYHHEFTRLANGHYMALGNAPQGGDAARCKLLSARGSRFFPDAGCSNMLYEFDAKGNLLWSWNSQDYVEHSDIGALLSYLTQRWQIPCLDNHENAFYFDEANKVIYLSYLTFNRIIKISYPSGKVISTYGTIYDSVKGKQMLATCEKPEDVGVFINQKVFGNGIFSGQHGCRKTKQGDLVVYNNMWHQHTAPQALMFREDKGGSVDIKKTWEFTCPTADVNDNFGNGSGGSVYEVSDSLLFISMNKPHGMLMLVNRDKKILWSAIPEYMNGEDSHPSFPYKASILSRNELEQLIWRSQESRLSEL